MTTTLQGKQAEDLAAAYLEQQQYRILQRNYRSRYGEIDIIGCEGEVLCFVEVRMRTSTEQCHPLETITEAKRHRLIRTAMDYLSRQDNFDQAARFDVISIVPQHEGPANIELIKNAFDVE